MTAKFETSTGLISGLAPDFKREVYLPNGEPAVVIALAERQGFKIFRGATLETFSQALDQAPADPRGGVGERVDPGDGIQLADAVMVVAT